MTSSHGPGGKSPPGPVKIHRFEKKHEPRRGAAASREYEGSVHERPTLPEFSLKPRQEGAAHERPTLPEFSLKPRQEGAAAPATTPREPPRAKERGSPARGTPAVPTAAVEGSEDSPLSGLMAERMATARSLFAQGQLTQARGILEKLVARGVAGAAAHSLLGTIYMAQGTLERALECFEEALARDPEDLSVRLHRGEVRMEKGDLLLAQQDLQHVLDMGTAGSPLVQQARRLLQQIDDRRNRRRR